MTIRLGRHRWKRRYRSATPRGREAFPCPAHIDNDGRRSGDRPSRQRSLSTSRPLRTNAVERTPHQGQAPCLPSGNLMIVRLDGAHRGARCDGTPTANLRAACSYLAESADTAGLALMPSPIRSLIRPRQRSVEEHLTIRHGLSGASVCPGSCDADAYDSWRSAYLGDPGAHEVRPSRRPPHDLSI